METLDSIGHLDPMTHIDPIYPMKILEPLGCSTTRWNGPYSPHGLPGIGKKQNKAIQHFSQVCFKNWTISKYWLPITKENSLCMKMYFFVFLDFLETLSSRLQSNQRWDLSQSNPWGAAALLMHPQCTIQKKTHVHIQKYNIWWYTNTQTQNEMLSFPELAALYCELCIECSHRTNSVCTVNAQSPLLALVRHQHSNNGPYMEVNA